MHKSDIRNHCEVCGAPMAWWEDKRFCSDTCRAEYHNNRRKSERRREKAIKAIIDIIDMADEPGVDAFTLLQDIKLATLTGGVWRCKK